MNARPERSDATMQRVRRETRPEQRLPAEQPDRAEIAAQIAELIDPTHPRDTVLVPRGDVVDLIQIALVRGVQQVEVRGGTFLTTSWRKARDAVVANWNGEVP